LSQDHNLPAKISTLPVAIEAMGGDFGCKPAVEGAVHAARELGISSILVGDETKLKAELQQLGASNESRISICDAPEVITMEDSPGVALRRKPRSSIKVAYELVRDGKASAVVSAGNTGAVMAAGLLIVGSLPGVARPAIATLIPKVGDALPTVLLDSGANIDCHAYQLVQFALMGSFYATSVLGTERPRIALLSNGTEATKGTDIIRTAAQTLSGMKGINFVGYIEGRGMGRDIADVVVCDGFVGNVVLKTMEGAVELVFDSLKHCVDNSSLGKLGMWLAKPSLKSVFKEKLDPSAYGGAPLLGLSEVGVICHGAANARAMMNGIRVAEKFVADGLVAKIGAALAALEVNMPSGCEDGIWKRMGDRFDKGKKPEGTQTQGEGE
jgi:glycerol-3-phosphate acyltransferase PlsX